ncbi:serine threonine kinase [Brachionus plicatilis]|uniref:Serine threonine kinase n=1 Tax=Brachionus plicatilis TaxID=10195 RepID=A0A3M7RHJ3_BRAPC|nr:serine threonine kinase [Brachionus plicatilis]
MSNQMDDLILHLPCGQKTLYKNLKNKPNIVECVECKSHDIIIEQVLNLPINRLKIKQIEYELELEKFSKLNESLDQIKKEPKFYLETNLTNVKNELNVRRDHLKKLIDDYYYQLNRKIEDFMEKKAEKIDKTLCSIETNIETNEINDQMDYETKSTLVITHLKNVKSKSNAVKNVISYVKSQSVKFVPSKNLSINDLFGSLILINENASTNYASDPSASNADEYNLKRVVNINQSINDFKLIEKNKFLIASKDHTISLWDTNKNVCLRKFKAHTDSVFCLCVLNDKMFASGSLDNSIKIWNIDLDLNLRTLMGHKFFIYCLKLTKSGHLLSGSFDKMIKKWDFSSGECVVIYIGHENLVLCLDETQDEKVLSASIDKTIRIWEANGNCLKVLSIHCEPVICFKILNNELVASGSRDGKIKIWNIETEDVSKVLEGHVNPVTSLKQLRNNQLISGSDDECIKVWDLQSGKCVQTIVEKRARVHDVDILMEG